MMGKLTDLENRLPLQRVHAHDGQSGRRRDGADEFLVGKLIDRGDVDMDESAHRCREAGRRETREGFVHYLDGPDLLLGEFVGPLEVVYLYLSGVGGRLDRLELGLASVDGSEELVYLILGQDFRHAASTRASRRRISRKVLL
jgi:hypothetical protein